ncbi:MAG: hypothetical protein ACKVOK_01350 [Flavobacteriales bacterium]
MKKPFKETKLFNFIQEKVKPIAGDALEIIGDITGRDSIEKVGKLLNGKRESDVQAQAVWIEFEEKKMEFELEFQQMELESFRAELDDKNSARSREIEFMKASGGKRDWIQGGIVIATFAILIACLTLLAFREIPKANERIFDMAFGGIVVMGAKEIYGYFFGSSRSSKHKDDIIRDAIKRE